MNILIVEDDPDELNEVRSACSERDSITTAESLREAREALSRSWPELVILDAIFPSVPFANPALYTAFNAGNFINTVTAIKPAAKRYPDVILVSGATEAAEHFQEIAAWLKAGTLYDVIPKAGFSSRAFFRQVLAHKIDRLRRDRPYAAVLSNARNTFEEMKRHGIVTGDHLMLRVWDRIVEHADPANQEANFYIWGEPGVGKELVAHAVAKLKNVPFKAVNVNRNDNVLPSEIFGTREGAYTDSTNNQGWIGETGKGVLFLDQFCSIDEKAQYALLRVLERDARDYTQLGGNTRIAECKFVLADTVSPLTALRAKPGEPKRLIPEMHSRLRFGAIEVPPLRARRGDIPLLAYWFLDGFNEKYGKHVDFTTEVIEHFAAGWWPGNVRALRDIVAGLVASHFAMIGWNDVCRWQDYPVLAAELEEEPGAPAAHSGPPQLPAGPMDAQASVSENQEAVLLSRLSASLLPAGVTLLLQLDETLKNRATNNPARHLVYGALLFVAEHREHSAGRALLEVHLPVKETQVNTLCKELGALLQGQLTDLARCEKVDNRYLLTMPRGILKNP